MKSTLARWLPYEVAGVIVVGVALAIVERAIGTYSLWLTLLPLSGVAASKLWDRARTIRAQPYRWVCDRCGTGIHANDPGVTATFADAHPTYCRKSQTQGEP